MGFLNNSGDIIIDATLTDVGRQRLAKGDGTFTIKKFAVGDDEINYELYNTSAGTIYADLNILQTPIMEAVTNNIATMKHKLMTFDRTDLLYLTTLKLNQNSRDNADNPGQPFSTQAAAPEIYVLLCTENAVNAYGGTGVGVTTAGAGALPVGFLNGSTQTGASNEKNLLMIEHELDTTDIPFSKVLDPDLAEDAFLFQVDDRFLTIADPGNAGPISPTGGVDEDNLAHYILSFNDGSFNAGLPDQTELASIINGPRGQRFRHGLAAQEGVKHNNALFTKFGYTISGFFTDTGGTRAPSPGLTDAVAIDTVVRVIGMNTGARLDIPVRLIREA
jgi:hypothetical protein